jgi:hypothetical protein
MGRVRRTLAGLGVAALLAWGINGLVPDARAASSSTCQPLPAPASSASASPTSSASAPLGASASPDQAAVTLCVTVQRTQASVRAGQTAGFTVQVQAQNGAAPDVSVTLTASAGQASFTGRCPSGDGTATCQLGSLATPTTPAFYTLNAQIQTLPGDAVTLTASAAAATTPPMTTAATAAATATVVPASTATSARPPTPSRSSAAAATPTPATVPTAPPAFGPVPLPVAESSTVLAPAGNASSLFPVIASSMSPSQQAAIPPASGTQAAVGLAPQSDSTSGSGMRLAAASAAIFGVLAIASLLLATRVSRRLRRHRHRAVRAIADGTAAVRDASPGSGEPESQVSHTASSATQAAEPREALPSGGQPHPGEYLG